jgi:hypothetical protein
MQHATLRSLAKQAIARRLPVRSPVRSHSAAVLWPVEDEAALWMFFRHVLDLAPLLWLQEVLDGGGRART